MLDKGAVELLYQDLNSGKWSAEKFAGLFESADQVDCRGVELLRVLAQKLDSTEFVKSILSGDFNLNLNLSEKMSEFLRQSEFSRIMASTSVVLFGMVGANELLAKAYTPLYQSPTNGLKEKWYNDGFNYNNSFNDRSKSHNSNGEFSTQNNRPSAGSKPSGAKYLGHFKNDIMLG